MQNQTWWIPAILSALFAALTTIFAKVGVTNLNSNVATAIRTLIVLAIAWGIVIAEGNFRQVFEISQRTLFFLVCSGIATGLSWLFYFRALQLGTTSFVVSIDKSSLVLVVLLSSLFLGEPFTLKALLGVLLIVTGTLVVVL